MKNLISHKVSSLVQFQIQFRKVQKLIYCYRELSWINECLKESYQRKTISYRIDFERI